MDASRRAGLGGSGSGSGAGMAQDDSRVFSTSYFHPGRGHLAHYESYLMRAVDHKGFLDVQEEEDEAEEEGFEDGDGGEGAGMGHGGGGNGAEAEWRTRYCVLKDGALSIYKVCFVSVYFMFMFFYRPTHILDPPKHTTYTTQEPPLNPRGAEAAEAGDAPLAVIPLDGVASVKSAERASSSSARERAGIGERKNVFMIITPERTWLFRAMAKADMQEWLFAFHRSLAVIVARLVDGGSGNGHGGGGHMQTPSTGFHRYGMGAGGLLSSRNDTNLMASRRGGLRYHVVEERGEMGHGHGRSLSGAPHRVRQVRGEGLLSVWVWWVWACMCMACFPLRPQHTHHQPTPPPQKPRHRAAARSSSTPAPAASGASASAGQAQPQPPPPPPPPCPHTAASFGAFPPPRGVPPPPVSCAAGWSPPPTRGGWARPATAPWSRRASAPGAGAAASRSITSSPRPRPPQAAAGGALLVGVRAG